MLRTGAFAVVHAQFSLLTYSNMRRVKDKEIFPNCDQTTTIKEMSDWVSFPINIDQTCNIVSKSSEARLSSERNARKSTKLKHLRKEELLSRFNSLSIEN